uniref:COP9 signalosome complex subunit 6 n=1 Tax=Macaca mulatta TaxID=9544 RepID=F6YPF9_MACMU
EFLSQFYRRGRSIKSLTNLSKVTRRRQAGTGSGKTGRHRGPEGVGLPCTECRPPRPGNCLLPGRQARRLPRRHRTCAARLTEAGREGGGAEAGGRGENGGGGGGCSYKRDRREQRDGGGCSSSSQRDGLRSDWECFRRSPSPCHSQHLRPLDPHALPGGAACAGDWGFDWQAGGPKYRVKQVFKELEFLGWYTTGGPPDPSDIHVHKQVCEIIESPLFLKLNPMTKHTDLPVSVFESVIDIINGEATMLFAELTYTLATEEAERIGVDHVARMTATGSGENSTVAEHLIAQHSAIKMLHSRVKLILEYVKASEAGEVPFNHEILREAYALCHCLPVLSTDKFKTDFYDQCNDVGLMAYLGTITKTCNTMNQFVNKFNVLYDRQGIGRRMRGLFF